MGMRAIIGAGLLMAAAGPAAAQKLSPAGTWLSQTGETRVRIAPCGGQMCGTIVWVKTPGKDVHNPDPGKRAPSTRPKDGHPRLVRSAPGWRHWFWS